MLLPENIRRLMSPEDRKKLGKAGMTQAEADAAFIARSERDLQKQIHNELLRRGIWHDCDAMHKRRTGTPGTPDFLFAINGQACAVEVKYEGGQLRPDQVKCLEEMRRNCWRVAVVRTFEEFVTFLREAQ